jgi:hypothetical protein
MHGSVSRGPSASNPSRWHCRRSDSNNLIFRGESVTPLTALLVAFYSIFIRSLAAITITTQVTLVVPALVRRR